MLHIPTLHQRVSPLYCFLISLGIIRCHLTSSIDTSSVPVHEPSRDVPLASKVPSEKLIMPASPAGLRLIRWSNGEMLRLCSVVGLSSDSKGVDAMSGRSVMTSGGAGVGIHVGGVGKDVSQGFGLGWRDDEDSGWDCDVSNDTMSPRLSHVESLWNGLHGHFSRSTLGDQPRQSLERHVVRRLEGVVRRDQPMGFGEVVQLSEGLSGGCPT